MKAKREVVVLVHDIRSTHNVGSIFRTSDAVGVSKIYLSGFSPTPKDKFGRWRKDVCKVALGAEQSITWEYLDSPINLIKKMKKEGFEVVGLEQAEKSIDSIV
jgi:tRNA G18 (ribose-2'-O)-methylase SpoU